jgi:hypothetical protein
MKTEQKRYNFGDHAILLQYHEKVDDKGRTRFKWTLEVWLNAAGGNTDLNPRFKRIEVSRTFITLDEAYEHGRRMCKGASQGAAND